MYILYRTCLIMHIYSVQVGLFKCSDPKKQFHRLKKKNVKMTGAESKMERGAGERVYNIGQRQVDIINEKFDKENKMLSDMVWTIILVLIMCQLFALLAVVCYGLYEHNIPSNILVANITTEYINSTSLYPIKVLNGSHVWKNYTVVKN